MLKNINWKVRLQDKTFVISMLGLVFLLVQQVLKVVGIEFDYTFINQQLTDIVGTIFTMLFLLGVIKDPTTEGFNDSERALTYTAPGRCEHE